MAGSAGIRHLVLVRHFWRDELEGVRADERSRYTLCCNLWHVAGDTLTPGTAVFVMRMLFQGRGVRTVG